MLKILSSVFDSNEDIEVLTNRCMKKLKGCIAMNFRKVRITSKKKTSKTEELHEKITALKTKTDVKIKKGIGIISKFNVPFFGHAYSTLHYFVLHTYCAINIYILP